MKSNGNFSNFKNFHRPRYTLFSIHVAWGVWSSLGVQMVFHRWHEYLVFQAYLSVSQLSVAITNTREKSTYKEERFILAFSSWLLGHIAFACRSTVYHGEEHWTEEAAHFMASGKQERQTGRSHGFFKGISPMTQLPSTRPHLCNFYHL